MAASGALPRRRTSRFPSGVAGRPGRSSPRYGRLDRRSAPLFRQIIAQSTRQRFRLPAMTERDPNKTRPDLHIDPTIGPEASPAEQSPGESLPPTHHPPTRGGDETVLLASQAPGQPTVPADRATRPIPEVEGYEILSELGRGGMGVVYKARDRKLNRIVALKMILAGAHAGSEAIERFRSEAEAVAQLQHPNIVQVFDVGQSAGQPWCALEFVDGGGLDDLLANQELSVAESAQLVETLARAMQSAHSAGIVHRDLKPANILLSTPTGSSGDHLPGGNLIPKVTDFGLAKRVEQEASHTLTGVIVGTPGFMAPEQARGLRRIGPAADIYALAQSCTGY